MIVLRIWLRIGLTCCNVVASFQRQQHKLCCTVLLYQTVLDALEDPSVLKDLEVLGLSQEQLIWILLRSHHARTRVLHAHLL